MASLRKLGFKKLCDLKVDPDGKISREFAKPKQYQYVVYAFVVGKKVMYIGKARDLWRRFNTYRNCITWSSPHAIEHRQNPPHHRYNQNQRCFPVCIGMPDRNTRDRQDINHGNHHEYQGTGVNP